MRLISLKLTQAKFVGLEGDFEPWLLSHWALVTLSIPNCIPSDQCYAKWAAAVIPETMYLDQ